MDREAVEAFWAAFRAASGVVVEDYDVFAFGDSPEMADELAGLVLHGPKRATAGLLCEFEHDGEPLPRVGGYSVVLDGRGLPVCVIMTTEVTVAPLGVVDARFAWDEGEGDRSLQSWLEAHRRFFERCCGRLGVPFSDELETVFERFELVWPRAGADLRDAEMTSRLQEPSAGGA